MPRKTKRSPAKTKFGYKQLEGRPARQLPPGLSVTADREFGLTGHRRNLAWNNAIDLEHNLTVIGWMIRLHLSYTANFRFQARTPDEAFNLALERHMAERSRPAAWDTQRKFSRDSMVRTFAMLKALHGDALVLKQRAGKFQIFEAWQIAKGKEAPKEVNDNGLVLDPFGATEGFAICSGDSSGELVHRYLAAWDECVYQMSEVRPVRPTQTRGESPFLVAMDLARDQLDNRLYRLFRSKIEAMFGVVLYRDHNLKGAKDFQYNSATATPPENDPATLPPLHYDLRPGLKLELEREDRAEFLESKTPNQTWLDFDKNISSHLLLAFDIPYSALDSSAANYSAMRADMNRYKLAIEHERERNAEAAHEMIEWALRADVAAGTLTLPAGFDFERDVDWELVPRATFILDEGKEVDAIIKKLSIGAMTYADAAKALGSSRSFRENLAVQAEEISLANAQGVSLARGTNPGAPETGPVDDNNR